MEQINEVNKLLKQAANLRNKSMASANEQISKLPIEQQKKYKALVQKAAKGNLTVEQLLKEIEHGKDS